MAEHSDSTSVQDVLDGIDHCLSKITEGKEALVRAQDSLEEAGQPGALGVLLESHDLEAQQALANAAHSAEKIVHAHQVLNRAKDTITAGRKVIAGDASRTGGAMPVPTPPPSPSAPPKTKPEFSTPEWAGKVGEELEHIRPTAGVAFDDQGNRLTPEPLRSGEGTELFRKTDEYLRSVNAFPVLSPRAPVPPASHVETQVALMMRRRGLRHATVVINKDRICDGPFSCWGAVAAILPKGASLTVWCQDQTVSCEVPGRSTA